MRLCPTVEGSPSPLITHRIAADVCQSRQLANFHKCHRCIYRGKPVDWRHEPANQAVVEAEAAAMNGTTRRRAAKARPGQRVADKVAGAES